jgi:hypothetical protein
MEKLPGDAGLVIFCQTCSMKCLDIVTILIVFPSGQLFYLFFIIEFRV